MSAGLRTSLLLAAALLLALPASSAAKVHKVGAGESVSSIAKRYYGTHDHAEALLRFNDRAGSLIHPGESLRIPYCEVHRVKPGDTWSALADKYMGRAAAYPTIAQLNGLSASAPLKVGQVLVMPVAVPYRLAQGDTLASVAQRFHAGQDLAATLQRFNGIDDPRRLTAGRTIEVPLTTLRLRQERPATKADKPPAASRRTEPAPEPAPRFHGEIEQARQAFEEGEYDRAQSLIATLDETVPAQGSVGERVALLRLEAFLAVAFDRPEQACRAYRSLVGLAAPTPLDPKVVSPKIRSTLEGCPAGS